MTRSVSIALFGFVVLLAATVTRLASPVAAGRITSRFGYRNRNGVPQHHNGIDIAAPAGTPVVAVGAGEVISTNAHPAGGNQLFLLLDSGMVAGYAHLQSYAVRSGRVKRGDPVGTVGTTGVVTGPHLHFSLRDRSGAYVDPLDYIQWNASE